MSAHPEKELLPPAFLIDPASLHILLVDASSSSRQHLASLLRECSYQVTACKTSQEAVQVLKAQQGPEGTAGFDLILKDHCPQAGTNACRLLRRAQVESVLQGIPIIVASTTEDRDVMVSCLQLGAADYMLKPLRHNELRNLWARVYWWRRASYLQQQPAGSVSLPAPVSQGSVGSDNTKCCSDDDEPQPGMICEIRSGEGSAPNDGSNGNGSGENGSKTGGRSSRNQAAKPEAHNSRHAEVDAKSNSANKAEQGSNHPSSDTGQAPDPKFGNGNSGVGHTANPQEPTPAGTEAGVAAPNASNVLLEIAPLQVEGSVPGSQSKDATPDAVAPSGAPPLAGQTSLTATATRPTVAASGFRAYIAKDNPRKRSSELAQKEEVAGGHSSGSDRTASVELHGSGKRRQVAQLSGPPASQGAASETMFQPPGMLTSAPPKAGAFGEPPSGSGSWSPLQAGQQPGNGFNAYYPFGVMPSPFSVPPQFWGQLPGSGSCSEADLSNLISYQQQSQSLGSSSRDREVQQGLQQQQQQGLQQQQMAMHNQLMYQHTILMQQYGMPAPPFPPFANYGGPAQQQQQAGQTQQPISLTGRRSEQMSGALPPPAGAATQKGGSSDKRTAAKSTWMDATTARQQSYPASGVATAAAAATGTATATGTGTATGNTLGAPGHSNAVTSHTTVQVGPDGCMVEPSRKERRAQALHKYKQKRKNLCFTKIRYESRKQLAQARPRVKGQFVRVRSEDVDDVVNALTMVQKNGASPGDAVVPQVAIERAGGNADTVAGLMAAAKKLSGDIDVSGEEDFEETFEEEDVNSPAHQIHQAAAKPAAATTATLPSSDSGSTSPEPIVTAVKVQG